MDVIIINQQEVGDLLTVPECMEVMEKVFHGLVAGECLLPLRQIMWLDKRVGALGMMPSHWESVGTIGLKAVTFFPGNEGTEHDTHQGAVLLYETRRGRLVAMVDATSITAIRTAAVSGVATRLLAREDAKILALIGSGVQANVHLDAMMACRAISSVRVCSKSLERAQAFANAVAPRHGVAISPTESVQEAVDGADIICTVTSSSDPVLMGEWLSPGVHINAVGSSVPFVRELDGEAVKRSRLFVDRRESALIEAGDFVIAKREGLVDDDHILGELGELLTNMVPGRTSPQDITLFKSVGLAIEDLAAARHVYDKARKNGAGIRVSFGGARHGPL